MIRWLFILIGSLIAFSLLKSIVSMVGQALGGGSAPQRREPGRPPSATSHELRRDPVCGTFIPASTQWVKQRDGELHHFCSEKCRDAF